jgi:hypothetical protein
MMASVERTYRNRGGNLLPDHNTFSTNSATLSANLDGSVFCRVQMEPNLTSHPSPLPTTLVHLPRLDEKLLTIMHE